MERISKNFKMSEFAASAKAAELGIPNEIPEAVKPAIRALVLNLLQPLCDGSGCSDIISSGYRSLKLNRLVGGVNSSQHRKGEAADNKFFRKLADGNREYLRPIAVMRWVRHLDLDFDQMIAYNNFVHLSYTTTRKNRKQILYSKTYNGERL